MIRSLITIFAIGLVFTLVNLSAEEAVESQASKEVKDQAVQPEKPKEFVSKDKGYAIAIPKNWETKELKEFGLDILVLIPPDANVGVMHERVTVIYAAVEGTADLEKFYKLSLENLKDAITDFKVDEVADVKLGNVDAKKILYSDKQFNDDIKLLQYFIVHKNRVYIITCSADASEYPRYKDLYEAVANSFRVID